MRSGLALVLALAFLVPLAVEAQPPTQSPTSDPVRIDVLADGANDVQVGGTLPGTANPTPRMAQLDLRAASVLETPGELIFGLTVAGLGDGAEPPLAESAFYMLQFLQGDVQYALQLGRIKSQDTGVFGMLARYDPAQDRYYAIDYVETTADPATATFTALVPRDLVVDSHGARPYPGVALSGFWAESQSFMEIFTFPVGFTGQPAPTIRDRMPDAGNGTIAVPILLGPVQTGSARLSSLVPTRQSNGEATTIVFQVEARNVGDAADRYRITARNAPREWQVTVPEDLLPLEAGMVVNFPVLVTVPFTHTHGTFRSLLLHMESSTDPASRADLELGIRYPRVPQPAGHHNLLNLHGARFTDDPTVPVYAAAFGFNMEYPWMNALEDDPGDQKVEVPADATFSVVPAVPDNFRWTVPLAPDLAIGLDFDLNRTGSFQGQFVATTPLLQATMSGELVLYTGSSFDEFGTRAGGNRTVLGHLAPSPPQDLQPNTPVGYTLPLAATPAADLIPYEPGTALVLELNLTGMRPDTFVAREPPRMRPGAILDVPLLEFHDPVDATFAATPHLDLAVQSDQDRNVNPGRTAVYQVRATLAPEAAAQTLRVSLSGTHLEWARLLDLPERQMQPGESWDFAVAITAPAGAKEKESADIVVRAQASGDATVQSLVRLYATVTTARDIPDEAALAASLDKTKVEESPGAGIGVLLAVLAAAMWVSRRRIP